MKHTFLFLIALFCLSGVAKAVEPVIAMMTTKSMSSIIVFSMKAQSNNTTIQVDFGNGLSPVSYTVGSASTTISGTIGGSQSIKIYGTGITSLDCSSNQISRIDVTRCTTLKELYCNNNLITALDVSQCTSLTKLSCSSNLISTLNITQCPLLTHLYCMSNMLMSLNISQCTVLTELNCNNNHLATLDASQCTVLNSLYCTFNSLTTLTVSTCTKLASLNCNNNLLTSINLPQGKVLNTFNCNKNYFTLVTLPIKQATWNYYSYIFQSPLAIPATIDLNIPVDLSTQATVNSNATTFIWKTASGTPLTEGIDYTISNGITTFLEPQTEKVHCEMTNATFPDFTGDDVFKTTEATIGSVTAVDAPTASSIDMYADGHTLHLSLLTASQVTVTDIHGRTIHNTSADSGHTTLALPGSGLYVVRVNAPDGVTTRKVMVK